MREGRKVLSVLQDSIFEVSQAQFEYYIACFNSLTMQNVLLGFRDRFFVYVISSCCKLGCYSLTLVAGYDAFVILG